MIVHYLLVCADKLTSIGVSNYKVSHLEELLEHATVHPAVLQVTEAGQCLVRLARGLLAHAHCTIPAGGVPPPP